MAPTTNKGVKIPHGINQQEQPTYPCNQLQAPGFRAINTKSQELTTSTSQTILVRQTKAQAYKGYEDVEAPSFRLCSAVSSTAKFALLPQAVAQAI